MSSFADLFRLDGKVALVTGGYGGIGEAVSRGLAELGAKVAVASRDAAKAEALTSQIGGYAAAFDGLSVADTRRMVDDVAAHYGRLDILVNCVGAFQEFKALEFEEDAWDAGVDANLESAMFQAQAAAQHMIKIGGGKQVHMGSVRSHLAIRGRGYAAYCAAKGGLALEQKAAEEQLRFGRTEKPSYHPLRIPLLSAARDVRPQFGRNRRHTDAITRRFPRTSTSAPPHLCRGGTNRSRPRGTSCRGSTDRCAPAVHPLRVIGAG